METATSKSFGTLAQLRPARLSSDPRVSVIINNYNYGDFIADAIDSALQQPDVEVVVVDNGSTDHSAAAIGVYGARLQGLFQPNAGQAAAINAGVQASRGEILCFLDADDWWAQAKVTAVVAAFDADPGVDLVYHRLQPISANGSPILKPIPRTLCSGSLTRRLSRSAGFWPFPLTSAISVRRSAWDRVGDIPVDFRISADAWLVGVYPFFGRVLALPSSLGFYRIHGSNQWTRLQNDAEFLTRRMAHWRTTVEQTNQFLAGRNMDVRLDLGDHFPYRLSAATLSGCDLGDRLGLVLRGFAFPGEPNLLRRARDAVRGALAPARKGVATGAAEARL